MRDRILEFVRQSLEQPSTDNKHIILGPIPEAVVQQIASENGIDLTDYKFIIDVYAVKHIIKSHGNAQKEEARGQKAITVDDFGLIYKIATEPDVVFYDGKNRIGRDVLQFQKRIDDRYVILKEVRTGKKQLALNSMRIIKVKRNQD